MRRRGDKNGSGPKSRPSGTVRSSTFFSRMFFVIGFGGVLALLVGFVRFGDYVTGLKHPLRVSGAQGAVSLTGGSDVRLKVGVDLVETKIVPRLLISGVNAIATAEEVRLVAGGDNRTFDCCIDLGREATDTVGNALEVAEWVAQHKVKTLILITDNYHMPRSLYEVRRATPGIKIIPYPVSAAGQFDKDWWKSERSTRVLALEYGKYLVALGRGMLEGDGKIALQQVRAIQKGKTA